MQPGPLKDVIFPYSPWLSPCRPGVPGARHVPSCTGSHICPRFPRALPALRCRIVPYLDQGDASRRRWPGVSGGLCLGRPARRTPGHTRRAGKITAGHRSRAPVQCTARLPRSQLPNAQPPRLGRPSASLLPSLDPASTRTDPSACGMPGQSRANGSRTGVTPRPRSAAYRSIVLP